MPYQLRPREQIPMLVDLESESTDEDDLPDFYRATRHFQHYDGIIDWAEFNQPSTSGYNNVQHQETTQSEAEEDEDPMRLTDEQVLDQETIKDFTCTICLEIVLENYRLQTCSNCLSSLCPHKCLIKHKETEQIRIAALAYSNPNEPIRCPTCREPLINRNRPAEGPKSIQILENLLCKCYFDPHCSDILKLIEYANHVSTCRYDKNNCSNCTTKNRSQQFHLDICMDEVLKIRLELEELRSLFNRSIITLSGQNKCLEEKESKIKQLQEKVVTLEDEIAQCNMSKTQPIINENPTPSTSTNSILTISNPIRSAKNHGATHTKFTINYLDRTFLLEGISLKAPGSVLKAEIEKKLGHEIGSILRLDYTPIEDNKQIWHHQFCYKPVVITALPVNVPVKRGQQLLVEIKDTGAIV